jgi:beta-N-acetylhexosaminidase
MRGAQREGLACCAKHFPGHGDTHTDSHHALPQVDKSLAELEALELRPFAALAAELPAIMTAHIVYPQIDPDHPATLSRALLGGVLRGRLAYDGVVITDALMMKAVHKRWGHARAAVMALDAGADMVLAQGSPDDQFAALDAIERALAEGRLSGAALARSRERLDRLALRHTATVHPYTADRRRNDEALMDLAWARALSRVGEAEAPARTAPLRVITQSRVDSDGVAEAGVDAAAVAALFGGFDDVVVEAWDDLRDALAAPEPVDGRTAILVSNHRLRYPPPGPLRRRRFDLHLALWNPYQVLDIAAPALVTWGYADGALRAARRWLNGEATAPGLPPVDLHSPYMNRAE